MLVILALLAAQAAGAQPSAVAAKADEEFLRVETARTPTLAQAIACAQSQAALAAALPAGLKYRALFRQGYCQMFAAIASRDSGAWDAAARDFQQAIAAWPPSPPAVPAGLRVLVPIARLEGGAKAASLPDIDRDLELAIGDSACPTTSVMIQPLCLDLVASARGWHVWLAWRKRNIGEAKRRAALLSPWADWIDGFIALERGQPAAAAKQMTAAMAAWSKNAASITARFGPPVESGSMHLILGQALHAAGQHAAAIRGLTLALAEDPRNAQALYLRARSRDLLGEAAPAMDGYAAAIEMARATNDTTWPTGEASYRRGVLQFRAGKFAAAAEDFARALESPLGSIPRADADAWLAWSAASQGDCRTAALAPALAHVSQQFPKKEAEGHVFRCQLSQASTLAQLVSLEAAYGQAIDAADLAALRKRIAAAYADLGVAADEKRESAAARDAYRKAVDYDPSLAKARFNLGAIYFEEKRFDDAEAEYRAIATADAADREAQFWLGASILAQKPDDARRAEACGWLKQAVEIDDTAKKADFAKTLAGARCP